MDALQGFQTGDNQARGPLSQMEGPGCTWLWRRRQADSGLYEVGAHLGRVCEAETDDVSRGRTGAAQNTLPTPGTAMLTLREAKLKIRQAPLCLLPLTQ